jgi:carotenoid cleavage dioxygenase-like enzyme
MDGVMNKTARDGCPIRGEIRRFRLNVAEGTVEKGVTLSQHGAHTTFPRSNPDWAGREYCFYYALEMFHNAKELGSYAVVKQNVCTGERTYHQRDNAFQSEPVLVPSGAAGADEDAGTVMFSELDGETGVQSLVLLNAKTMAQVSRTELPPNHHIPFTLHGAWYPEPAQSRGK